MMKKPFPAARMAALLLAGTALTLPAIPALANGGQILTMEVGRSQRAPLIPGQRITTTSTATQVLMPGGAILSFVQGGSFTVDADGGIDIHAGNATVLAAREPLTVRLPDGASASLATGASGSFVVGASGFTGSVLTGRVDISAAGTSRGFEAGQAWRADPGRSPTQVLANAAQAVPAVASQRQGGIAAAAANGQPVGLGQALAAVGASGDVIAAASRLQASAQNPALATIPAADAAALVSYAASLAQLYGAPAFQGAGPDLVRTYLSYLGQGGSPAAFQATYADLVSRYLSVLRAGGVPADFAGASEAAINAYLDYIRSTGALSALPEQDRAFINRYLEFLQGGGTGAGFTALYTQAISAFLAHVQAGGLPSAYAGLSAELVRQYLEMLQSTGLLQSMTGAQAEFLNAYLAYLRTGADPDKFPGLPGKPVDPEVPVDPPSPATPVRVAGSTVAILPDRDIHMAIGAQDVGFIDGKPENIPDGTSVIVTDEAKFADLHVDDRFFIGRLTEGRFRQFQRDHVLNADQGVHYAYLRTDGTTIPASGTVTYGLVAATKPTFASGASAAGTFDARMAVAWGAAPRVGVAGTLAMPGDATYAFTSEGGVSGTAQTGVALSGYGQNAYQFSNALTGTGRACAGSGCTIRFLVQPGGPEAEALSVTYATGAGEGLDRITGAAGFRAVQDPGTGPEQPAVTVPALAAGRYHVVAGAHTAADSIIARTVAEVAFGEDNAPARLGTAARGTVKLLDGKGDAAEGWQIGRYGDGELDLSTTPPRGMALSASQGLHYLLMRPATEALPTIGRATYAVKAFTTPTYAAGGEITNAALTGGLAVDFGLRKWGFNLALGFDANGGRRTYSFGTQGGLDNLGVADLRAPDDNGQVVLTIGQAATVLTTDDTTCGANCGAAANFVLGGADNGLAGGYYNILDKVGGQTHLTGGVLFGRTGFSSEPPPTATNQSTAFVVQTPEGRAATVAQRVLERRADGTVTKIGNYDAAAARQIDGQKNEAQGWELGRFSEGQVKLGGTAYTLGAGQAAHFAAVKPLSAIPASGRIDYAVSAYTNPTYANGAAIREARVNGLLAVEFGRNLWSYRTSVSLIDNDGARNYSFGFASGLEQPTRAFTIQNNAISLNGDNAPLTTDDPRCAANACSVLFNVGLGGEGADSGAGIYQISRGGAGQTNGLLSGALVFRDVAKGGGITDAATGTERTNRFVAYAGSGIGIDQRDQVTTLTEADGTLNKYVWTVNNVEAPQRGSNKSLETGTAGGGVIGWSRWADGIAAGTYFEGPQFARSEKQGMHLVHGEPATNLPTSGTAAYSLTGATRPTIRDGSVDPGTMTGSAAIAFGATARVGLDMQVTIGGHGYAVTTNGGVANPGSSQITVGSNMGFRGNDLATTAGGPACSGASCTASVTGFLAGAGASHIGISYTINGGTFDRQVDGAAVFGR